MFKTILVPVDLAEVDAAMPALEKAVALAGNGDSSVRLIYVRPVMPTATLDLMPPAFDAEQQADAEKRLAEVAATVALPPERVSAVVRFGPVYAEVLDEAEKTGADLVVIGSHRPSMASFLLGSNASTIVRHAKCSVLVVRR